MNSHEYAKQLRVLADFLDSKPEFETKCKLYAFFSYYEKDDFLAAVKAVGSGKKEFTDNEIQFLPVINDNFIHLRLTAPRSAVCRLVQEAKYECDPLLSPEEEAAL